MGIHMTIKRTTFTIARNHPVTDTPKEKYAPSPWLPLLMSNPLTAPIVVVGEVIKKYYDKKKGNK